MRILVVEDDEEDMKLIRAALSNFAGIRICQALTLQNAFKQLQMRSFDLVVLDLQLPDSGGLKTFLRVFGAFPTIPVVILSGANDEALATEAVRRGAQDYIVKGEMPVVPLQRAFRFACERNRRIRAEHRSVELLELERKRIARDLHDGAIQALTGLRLQLQILGSELRKQGGAADSRLNLLADISLEAIEELRRTCRNLHPEILERMKLGEALLIFAERIREETGINVDVAVNFRGELSRDTERHLYRIVQEAVRNSVRYAKVSRLTVEIGSWEGRLCIVVRDEGIGFALSEVEAEGSGMGLRSIQQRAEILSGRVSIVSAPNRGTTVSVDVPVRSDFFPDSLSQENTFAGHANFSARDTVGYSKSDTIQFNMVDN